MRFLFLLLLLLAGQSVISQSKPGLYLTMDFDLEYCDNKMKLINADSVYCLSQEPIIEFDSFERVDELVYDSLFQMRRFRIVLTQKGQDYISTLAQKLPNNDLGLVVNGILVSIIDLDGIYHPRTIVIWDRNDSQAMEWVHRTLVRTVARNNKKS